MRSMKKSAMSVSLDSLVAAASEDAAEASAIKSLEHPSQHSHNHTPNPVLVEANDEEREFSLEGLDL